MEAYDTTVIKKRKIKLRQETVITKYSFQRKLQ